MPTVVVPQIGIDPKQPIGIQTYAILKRMILDLTLVPNQALSEKELALMFGVSRTPVREALIRLAGEMLVDIFPQRGTFVSPIRMGEVLEAQFLRESVEAAVVRRAAEQAPPRLVSDLTNLLDRQSWAADRDDRREFMQLDEAFHRAIGDSVAMPRAWQMIQSVKGQLDRVRFLSLPDKQHNALILSQHADIVKAIEMKDPDLAESSIRHHLKEVLDTVNQLMRDDPNIFS